VDDEADWPVTADASRRTRFAEERTLLAWWRTGIAMTAVAIAVGGIVPHLSGLPRERFILLGVGYGAVALVFVIGGTMRSRASTRALDRGEFIPTPMGFVLTMTVVISALVVLTVLATL
jgi:putative membrane protein